MLQKIKWAFFFIFPVGCFSQDIDDFFEKKTLLHLADDELKLIGGFLLGKDACNSRLISKKLHNTLYRGFWFYRKPPLFFFKWSGELSYEKRWQKKDDVEKYCENFENYILPHFKKALIDLKGLSVVRISYQIKRRGQDIPMVDLLLPLLLNEVPAFDTVIFENGEYPNTVKQFMARVVRNDLTIINGLSTLK